MLRQVDWARTRAYAIGLSGIYLNLKGREGQGIVPSDDAELGQGRDRRKGLTGLADPERAELCRDPSRAAARGGLSRCLRRGST